VATRVARTGTTHPPWPRRPLSGVPGPSGTIGAVTDHRVTDDDHTTDDHSLYETMFRRRDTRAEFTGAPIPDDTLRRVLTAAHAAPSVGLSQPWDFVLVSDVDTRKRFREHVYAERAAFAEQLDEQRAGTFARIRIEGILESTVGIVVGYDPARGAPAVLGRHAIADAGVYSVCLAIQNLWLAATAEGLGVGWVSFYREEFLRDLVGLPSGVRPVAWLCVGPVRDLPTVPDLERHGWRQRLPLDAVVHRERFGNR
jgi:5,6-dimethylbenzimidazole synthase